MEGDISEVRTQDAAYSQPLLTPDLRQGPPKPSDSPQHLVPQNKDTSQRIRTGNFSVPKRLGCDEAHRYTRTPVAKPSLPPTSQHSHRRAGRESVARCRLYFVGYVTLNPSRNVAPPSPPGGIIVISYTKC